MYWVQRDLTQPFETATLIRYMDEWKFNSFQQNGLCLTQVFSQEDNNDGRSVRRSGLSRMINNNDYGSKDYKGKIIQTSNHRQNTFISCWAIDNKPLIEKFNNYCFKKGDQKATNHAYAISINYTDLVTHLKLECKIDQYQNIEYQYKHRHYYVTWGKVDYIDLSNKRKIFDASKQFEFEEAELFFKDKKYGFENEFRIMLSPASMVLIPVDNNYLHKNEAESLVFIDGLNKNCNFKIYEYKKATRKITQMN